MADQENNTDPSENPVPPDPSEHRELGELGDQEEGADGGTQILVRPTSKTKAPSFYKVVLLNDDFTPRDFVVHILQKFFRKSEPEAVHLMLQVHQKGAGIAGVFTHEIAETKAYQVNEYAKQHSYPLKATVEKA